MPRKRSLIYDNNARLAHTTSASGEKPAHRWVYPNAPSGANHLVMLKWLHSKKRAMQPDGAESVQSQKALAKTKGSTKVSRRNTMKKSLKMI